MTQGAADSPHNKPPAKQPDKGAAGATDPQSHDEAIVVPPDDGVQKVRAWTGLLVVAVGDIAIVIAAIVGIAHVSNDSANTSSIVAILSSGFTAVGTMTTAYFGIRAASNTAQSSMKKPPG
jgi:arginine exporter protein ArgO